MRSIVSAHESAPQGSPETFLLKQYAKALILYTAQIPFRFPVSTNSLLLQLRSRIVWNYYMTYFVNLISALFF